MNNPKDLRNLHQLENELLLVQEEERQIARANQELFRKERTLEMTLAHTRQELESTKSLIEKNKGRTQALNETLTHLKTKIKLERM